MKQFFHAPSLVKYWTDWNPFRNVVWRRGGGILPDHHQLGLTVTVKSNGGKDVGFQCLFCPQEILRDIQSVCQMSKCECFSFMFTCMCFLYNILYITKYGLIGSLMD